MIFTKSSNYPIGLDISDLSLKLVQLKKVRDKIKIQALGKINLPNGLIEKGEIKDKQGVVEMINKLISKPKLGSVNSSEVVACLPETKTFIKLIEVAKTPNNLIDIIGTELEKHIPVSTKEIFYDWQTIDENRENYSILIGVAPKNIVNQYIDLLNEAKLSITALEIESTAICRSLLAEEKPKFKGQFNKNYGLIDIGAKRTSMIIYSKDTIVLSISMPISGEEITESIAKTLEIKNDQAEKAKIICGLDKDKAQGIINEILSDMINKLNHRINDTLEYYNNNYPNRGPINEILLCGGGSNIKSLNQIINQTTSINTKEGDAFINLNEVDKKFAQNFMETHNLNIKLLKNKKDQNISIKQSSSLSYTTAIGLALRNIFMGET